MFSTLILSRRLNRSGSKHLKSRALCSHKTTKLSPSSVKTATSEGGICQVLRKSSRAVQISRMTSGQVTATSVLFTTQRSLWWRQKTSYSFAWLELTDSHRNLRFWISITKWLTTNFILTTVESSLEPCMWKLRCQVRISKLMASYLALTLDSCNCCYILI